MIVIPAETIISATDYFATLGVTYTFEDSDAAQLERRFHELQKQSHPDRFAGAGARVLGSALEESSRINEAYRTLRNPIQRTKHLLGLFGYSVERSKNVPSELFELVMNVQEKVAELEFADEKTKELILLAIAPLLASMKDRKSGGEFRVNKLRRDWDSQKNRSKPGETLTAEENVHLEQLTRELAGQAYLHTLLESLTAAINGQSLILKH